MTVIHFPPRLGLFSASIRSFVIRWLKRSSARHILTAAKRIRQAERME